MSFFNESEPEPEVAEESTQSPQPLGESPLVATDPNFDDMNRLLQSGNQAQSSGLAQTNFGSFRVRGVAVNRWRDNRDIAAWRDTNRPLVTLNPEDTFVHDIAASANGRFMVAVGSKMNIWDLDSFTLVRSWDLESVGRKVLITPQGDLIVSLHDDNIVKVWQQATGFKIAELRHDSQITTLAISPDGISLATADINGRMRIWNVQTGEIAYSVEDVLRINALAFSPDGLFLASAGVSANDVNNTIQIWETRYYTVFLSLPGHQAIVNDVVFSPNSEYVVSASRDNTIKIWNLTDGVLIKSLRGHTDDVIRAVFSGTGGWLVSSSLDNSLNIWSLPDGRIIKVVNVPFLKADTLDYVRTRNWIAVASSSLGIQIWASTGFTYRIWTDIRERVKILNEERLQTVQIPFIPKPQLPPIRALRKGVFESQIKFMERVAGVYGQEINRSILNYRRQVDARNRRVATLRQNQQDQNEIATQFLKDIAIRTTQRALGSTLVFPLSVDELPAYDPDRQRMLIRVSFSRAFFREDLQLRMPEGEIAQLFYNDLQEGNVIGTAEFEFVTNTRIRVSQVLINWRGQQIVATPVTRNSGYRIIPEESQLIGLNQDQLEFQRYDIPYTNFNDFIREVLRDQIETDIDSEDVNTEVPQEVTRQFQRSADPVAQ